MLTAYTTTSYNQIVNIAIASKEKYRLHKEAKKRKNVTMGFSGGNNQCTTRNIHFYDENLNDESKTIIEERFL